jgi:hypothetical protein
MQINVATFLFSSLKTTISVMIVSLLYKRTVLSPGGAVYSRSVAFAYDGTVPQSCESVPRSQTHSPVLMRRVSV